MFNTSWMKYHIPAYLYAGLILAASSYSLTVPPGVPSFSDKIIHFAEYAILGLLLGRAFLNAKTYIFKKFYIFIGFLVGSSWGLFDELYQTTVPLRGFEVGDLIADSIGVLIGIFIYKYYNAKE